MKEKKILIPILLVIATNVFVLLGISSNRALPPEASLLLTERELSLSRLDDENSGTFLKINWDIPIFNIYNSRHVATEYLDQDKLNELGWNCPIEIRDTHHPCYRYRSSVKSYIVLEYGGPSWENWLESQKKELLSKEKTLANTENENTRRALENEIKRIKKLPIVKSRLFAIDFSPDPIKLRKRYPDRNRYIILPGLIRMHYNLVKKEKQTQQNRVYRLKAHINELLIKQIYVADEFRDIIENRIRPIPSPFTSYGFAFHKVTPETKPRFQVKVNFGKRYEPWIESVSLIK